MDTAPYFRLSNTRAREILRDVEAAVSTWRVLGAELGMDAGDLDAFAGAFEHEERQLARRLV